MRTSESALNESRAKVPVLLSPELAATGLAMAKPCGEEKAVETLEAMAAKGWM